MYEQQLVPKLIDTLSPERSSDEHSAASYTLVDIVAKTSRSTNLVLFTQLSSDAQIKSLMKHMFAGNRSSLLESLSVLLALLHHYPNVSAEKHVEQCSSSAPPISPEGSKSTHTNEDNRSSINDILHVTAKAVAKWKMEELAQKKLEENPNVNNVPPPPPPTDENNATPNVNPLAFTSVDTGEDSDIPAVVQTVCRQLQEFKVLLLTAPDKELELPFVTLNPPLGPVRHKVVDMIVALMRTPSDRVSQRLRNLGFISICMNLFFQYPWNNLLHGSVEHIVQMVVSGQCCILKKALFEDCDFLQRILNARVLSATHVKQHGFRLGFMGHLTRVSNTIVEFAKRDKQLEDYMNENAKWMEFIEGDLKLENEKLNTQLGGHRPTQLQGTDEEDEFTSLFHMNDSMQDEDDMLGMHGWNNDEHDDDDNDDNNGDDDNDGDVDTTAAVVDDNDNNLLLENGMQLNALAALNMGVMVNKDTHQIVRSPTNKKPENDENKKVLNGEKSNNNNSGGYVLPSDIFDGFTQDLDTKQNTNINDSSAVVAVVDNVVAVVDNVVAVVDNVDNVDNVVADDWASFADNVDNAWLDFSELPQRNKTIADIKSGKSKADATDFDAFFKDEDFFDAKANVKSEEVKESGDGTKDENKNKNKNDNENGLEIPSGHSPRSNKDPKGKESKTLNGNIIISSSAMTTNTATADNVNANEPANSTTVISEK